MNVLFILAKPIFCGDMQMHKIMTNYDGCLRVTTPSACKSVHNGISLNVGNSKIDNVLDISDIELTFIQHSLKFTSDCRYVGLANYSIVKIFKNFGINH